MVSKNKEQLSAWLDGELTQDELTRDDGLKRELSPELATAWQNYHLVGEVLRDELPQAVDPGFADRLSALIREEPAIVAPVAGVNDSPLTPEQTTTPPAAPRSGNVLQLFGKFGQYGIAASVAAAMVIGVQQYSGAPSVEQPLPVLQTMPVGGYAAPVSLQAEPVSQAQQRLEHNQRLEQQQRLNAILQDHRLQQRLKAQAAAEKESALQSQK